MLSFASCLWKLPWRSVLGTYGNLQKPQKMETICLDICIPLQRFSYLGKVWVSVRKAEAENGILIGRNIIADNKAQPHDRLKITRNIKSKLATH